MKNVVSSAAEAEIGALFHNAQDACTLRQTLIEIGHPKPPTPMVTDNQCAEGIINDTVKMKRSKAMDMKYFWLKDRKTQEQFHVHWEPGVNNQADYFTKHHDPAHHIAIRSNYLHNNNNNNNKNTASSSEGVLKSPPRISNPESELPVEPTTSTSPQVLLSNSAISTIPDQHFSCAPGLSMNYDSNLLRRQHDLLPNCSLAVIAQRIGFVSKDTTLIR